MKNVLCATRFCYLDEQLYFLTEQESLLGRICIKSGRVFYDQYTLEDIMGHNVYDNQIHIMDKDIYVIGNNGKCVWRRSMEKQYIEKIYCDEIELIGGCAGIVCVDGGLYVFGRDEGQLLKISEDGKKVSKISTQIKDKIMWACEAKGVVYALTWDGKVLYEYNLKNGNMKAFSTGIIGEVEMDSKSIIPFHGMCIDDSDIYIHDAKRIFRYDTKTKDTTILNCNNNKDNGSRIIILDKVIVVPSMNQERFYILRKKNGEICKTEFLPANIENMRGWIGSGVPCYTSTCTYLPIVNSNMILQIDNRSSVFKWIELKFDKQEVENIMSQSIGKKKVIIESPLLMLPIFLNNI